MSSPLLWLPICVMYVYAMLVLSRRGFYSSQLRNISQSVVMIPRTNDYRDANVCMYVRVCVF